jgi:hypothetical protein
MTLAPYRAQMPVPAGRSLSRGWCLRWTRRRAGGHWERWWCQAPAGLPIVRLLWIQTSGGEFTGGWIDGRTWYAYRRVALEDYG